MNKKVALILGVRGQDASYLAEILLEKGYQVIGLMRRTTHAGIDNIAHLIDSHYFHNGQFIIYYGDVLDQPSLNAAIRIYQPDEVYHLAAMSFVGDSWTQPEVMCEITGMGTLRILEAIRQNKPDCRFYCAGSSEAYGKVQETPQTEKTPFYPRSPYGVSKAFSIYMTRVYRESYGMHASSGILFNHDSARRGHRFFTRKVTDYVARLHLGLTEEKLKLGNIDTQRDIGHSRDYMQAAWLMLQQDQPGEYVVASGKTHSMREFLEQAFLTIGKFYFDHIQIDESLIRPAEVDLLLGDASKAKRELGWEPQVSFEELVREMVENDIQLLKNQSHN